MISQLYDPELTWPPDHRSFCKTKCKAGILVTFDDEQRMDILVSPSTHNFLTDFYEWLEDDWFARKEMPEMFHSEFDLYEWLFKRAMAGRRLTTDDYLFMFDFEANPQYRELAGRYDRLKELFADELDHAFGTLKGHRQ